MLSCHLTAFHHCFTRIESTSWRTHFSCCRRCSFSRSVATRRSVVLLPWLPPLRLHGLRGLAGEERVGYLLDAWDGLPGRHQLHDVRKRRGVRRWRLARIRRRFRESPACTSRGRSSGGGSLYAVGHESGAPTRIAVCFVGVEVDVLAVFPETRAQARCSSAAYLA
jgi:hypothetical protein